MGWISEEVSTQITVIDRKSTRLNSSHSQISYAVFCLKKKKKQKNRALQKIQQEMCVSTTVTGNPFSNRDAIEHEPACHHESSGRSSQLVVVAKRTIDG